MGNRTTEESYDSSNMLHRLHTRVINTLNQLYQDVNSAGTAAVTTTYDFSSVQGLFGLQSYRESYCLFLYRIGAGLILLSPRAIRWNTPSRCTATDFEAATPRRTCSLRTAITALKCLRRAVVDA